MIERNHTCQVQYHRGEIVLVGTNESVHREAHRLIKLFEASACPYRLAADKGSVMILRLSAQASAPTAGG